MGSVAQIVEAISTLAAALKYVPAPPPAHSSSLPTRPLSRSLPAHPGCLSASPPPRFHLCRLPPCARRPCLRPRNPPRRHPIPSRPRKPMAPLPRPPRAPPLSSRPSSRRLCKRQSLSKPSFLPSSDAQTRLNVFSPHFSPTPSPPPTALRQPPLRARPPKILGPQPRAKPFSTMRTVQIARSSLATKPSLAFRCFRSLGRSSTVTSPPSNFAPPTPAPNSLVSLLTVAAP